MYSINFGEKRLSKYMISPKQLAGFVVIATLSLSAVSAATQPSLRQTLEPYLKEYNLPAFAAAVFKQGVVIASGAAGTRHAGIDIPVQIDDRFHLGSDTKAFTSLLVGQLVQQGKWQWDSTLAQIFPELKETMDPEFAKITRSAGVRLKWNGRLNRQSPIPAPTK